MLFLLEVCMFKYERAICPSLMLKKALDGFLCYLMKTPCSPTDLTKPLMIWPVFNLFTDKTSGSFTGLVCCGFSLEEQS